MTATPLTPTERRLFDLFRDGLAHTRAEMLKTCGLDDDQEGHKELQAHVCNLRKKLGDGELVLETIYVNRQARWRLFRRLYPSDE